MFEKKKRMIKKMGNLKKNQQRRREDLTKSEEIISLI